jgi:hypothetical protein
VTVHFIKYTLLKAQVRDGVKEELTLVAKNWCKFAQIRLGKYVSIGIDRVTTLDAISDTDTVKSTTLEAAGKPLLEIPEVETIMPHPGTKFLDMKLYFIMLFVFIIFIQYWYNSKLSLRMTLLEKIVENQLLAHKNLVSLYKHLSFKDGAEE